MPRKNREDVEKEIADAQRGGRQINLRDWDLERVDLSGLNLTGADLRGVNLNYANLVSVNLTGADFSGIGWDVAVANAAFPSSSDLIYARNFGTFWRESTSSVGVMARMAMLTNVRVKQSQLNTANLTGATLTGANLTGANCAGTRFLLTNFQNAIVSGVDLKDSLLINPNLTGTGLGPENLTDSIVSFVPVESENYRNSLKLLIKIHSLKTVYARPTDICAITHLSGSEIKSPVYIKKSNGDFDCYDREALKTWIREGNVINPLTRELITPEMLSEVPWTPEFFERMLFQRLLQQLESESPSPSPSPSPGVGFNG